MKNTDLSGNSNDSVVQMVDLYSVEPDREQARKSFDPDKLQELADSISRYGVLQPILVQKEKDYYKIIAGERRWRAARIAGLTEVPVIVREFSTEDKAAVSLIENLQRQNLNPMEESAAYQKLIDDYGMTQEEVASRIGKSRAAVANSLRLQNLPDSVRRSLAEGMISEGHAKVILGVSDPVEQARLAVRVIGESLSVRDLEKIVGKARPEKKKGKPASKAGREAMLAAQYAEKKLGTLLGTKVSVTRGVRKGMIEIEYYSEEDLERILSVFGK
ncbi:MAG: ParB/RepB/Spo0J family partition protein [Firmicutes bacterium]|nr:ParB/RepB/Spo0J family partition protein [Bacillota bacterium]